MADYSSNTQATLPVAEIVLTYPNALTILNRHSIDYCCGGKRSFKEACDTAGVNPDKIWDEIVHDQSNGNPYSLRFTTWDPPLLVDYIIQNHHAYVKQAIPQLLELLDKVCDVHGEEHDELNEIREEFKTLSKELLVHLNQEEQILFPAIKLRFQDFQEGYNFSYPKLEAPISGLEHDHEVAGDLLKSLRQRTNHYTPPADACPTYQLTYKKLAEFDQDLMQHVHIENNVLFEKIKDN